MMEDKELLELAAKAAGYVVTGRGGMSRGVFVYYEGAQPDECGDLPNFHWDPLTDDGDALRLLRLLELDISHDNERHAVSVTNQDDVSIEVGMSDEAGNIYAPLRRAIVRAAAELARTK